MDHLTDGAPVATPLGAGAGWLAQQGRWVRLGIAMLAGAAMTLGQPPGSLPWALFAAVPVLVWLIDAAPCPRAAALAGWGAGFGYFVTGLYWIGHAFLVDAESRLASTGGAMPGMDHGDQGMAPQPDTTASEHEHDD